MQNNKETERTGDLLKEFVYTRMVARFTRLMANMQFTGLGTTMRGDDKNGLAGHVDQLAAKAAELARRLESWDETQMELIQRRAVPSDQQLAEADKDSRQFNETFQVLYSFLSRRARNFARRQGALESDAEEFLQEVALRVSQKLAQYDPHQSKVSAAASGAQFGAWLATVIRRLWLDRMRRTAPLTVPIDERWIAAQTAAESSFRQGLAQHFTSGEEEVLGAERPELRNLLLYTAGLWPLVSEEKQRLWSDFPSPALWECAELTAKQRAAHYARRLAEQLLRQTRDDDLDESDSQQNPAGPLKAPAEAATDGAELQSLLERCSQRVAHNLKRHYWKLFELETAWQHLLRYVLPIDAEWLDRLDDDVDRERLVSWLYFDIWFAIDRAARWKKWLHASDIKNTTAVNTIRVAALPWHSGKSGAKSSPESEVSESVDLSSSDHRADEGRPSARQSQLGSGDTLDALNANKLAEIGRLVFREAAPASRHSSVLVALVDQTDQLAKNGPSLFGCVRRLRQRVDLPLPYALTPPRRSET